MNLDPVITRVEADLRANILPFWIARTADREHGGFVGSMTNDLQVDPSAERGALLTSRILWTFSAAHARYGDPAYRDFAHYAYHDLMTRFRDRAQRGFWWSLRPDGTVLRPRKQVYGQAFALYSLSEYYAAAGEPAALAEARALFALLERHARDRRHGGYWEAFGPEWEPVADVRLSAIDQNDPKSQNTHLHVLEAYTRLLQVQDDPEVRAALRDLAELMITRILDPRTGHLGLFFGAEFERRSTAVSYGHDIEAAWLLTRAAEAVGEPALLARVRALAVRIAEVCLAEGVDADGGLFNAGGPDGPTDTNKEWWPQAEAVIGFLNAAEISGEERFLRAALRSWEFIERHLIDRTRGEWLRGVTRHGEVLAAELKVGFWKCPYHNGRAALEAIPRLRALGQRLPTFA